MDATKESKKENAEEKSLRDPAAAADQAGERLLADSLPRTEKSSTLPVASGKESGAISNTNNSELAKLRTLSSSNETGSPLNTAKSGLEFGERVKGFIGFSAMKDQGRIQQEDGKVFAGFNTGKDQSRLPQADAGSKDQSRVPQSDSGFSSKDQSRISQSDSGISSKEQSRAIPIHDFEGLPNTTIIEKRAVKEDPYANIGSTVMKETMANSPLSFNNPKVIQERIDSIAEKSVDKYMKPNDSGSTSYHIDRTNKSDSMGVLNQLDSFKGVVGACNTEEAKVNGSAASFAVKDKMPEFAPNAQSAHQITEAYRTINPEVNTAAKGDMLKSEYNAQAAAASMQKQMDFARDMNNSPRMGSDSLREYMMSKEATSKEFTTGKEISGTSGPANVIKDYVTPNSTKDFSTFAPNRDFSAGAGGGKEMGVPATGGKEFRTDGLRSESVGPNVRDFTGKDEAVGRPGISSDTRAAATSAERSGGGAADIAPARSQSNNNFEPTRTESRSTQIEPTAASQSSRTLPDAPLRSSSTIDNVDADRKSRTIDLPMQQGGGSIAPQSDKSSQNSPLQSKVDVVTGGALARQSTGADAEIALQAARGLAAFSLDKAAGQAIVSGGQKGESVVLPGVDRSAAIIPLSDKAGSIIAGNVGERGAAIIPGTERAGLTSAQNSAGIIPAGDRNGLTPASALNASERGAAIQGATERGATVNTNAALAGLGDRTTVDATGKQITARVEDAALAQIGRKDAGIVAGLPGERIAQNSADGLIAGNKINSMDPLTGNIRVNADGSIIGNKADAIISAKLQTGEKVAEATVDATGKIISRTADGQIVIGRPGEAAAQTTKTPELMIVDGEAIVLDENGVPVRRIKLGSNDKRYLTGVELTIAAVIAMSGAAKVREEMLINAPDASNGNADADGNKVLHRRTHLVQQGETLQSIAEALYQNPAVAWLIADLNASNIKEDIIDGRRVVELKTRQQLELPEPEEVTHFLTNLRRDFEIEQLITVVSETTIDRELLNNFLGTVTGGVSTTTSTAVAVRTEVEEQKSALPELTIDLGHPDDLPVGLGIAAMVKDLSDKVGRMVKRPATATPATNKLRPV